MSSANAQTITTIVGTGTAGFSGDWGPPLLAEINTTNALCFGAAGSDNGSLYLVDQINERIRAVKLGLGGVIYTVAGNGIEDYCGDSLHATAECINWPGGVACDAHGNVYIGDYNNQRIRKVDVFGYIHTIAGTGIPGFSGDGGPASAAQFYNPYNVVVDQIGNLFIADQYNHRIRKIDTAGIITTVAGNGTPAWSGDGGQATNASLSYPNYVHIDALDRLYITDNGNHIIRRVDTNGVITTVAGNGTGGFSGDGGPATNAQLKYPTGASVDHYGNLIIADAFNYRIRKVDAVTHHISTIAGTGVSGSTGDGGPATAATLNYPMDIAFDNANNIYFPDYYNNKIRMISAPESVATPAIQTHCFIQPNPSNGTFEVNWSNLEPGQVSVQVFDLLGRQIAMNELQTQGATGSVKFALESASDGIYVVRLSNLDIVWEGKVSIRRN
jgi:hypothetical protein